MLKTDETGRCRLSFENTGVIRRLPVAKTGVAKTGREWTLGSVLLEVTEEDVQGSAQLYLITWDALLVETLERIGVGKRVRVRWHLETREKYDSYVWNAILDDIGGLSENEDYMYDTKGKEASNANG